jgi:hypothetical protein
MRDLNFSNFTLNKIEGSPILKLAMVKRVKGQKNLPKIKILKKFVKKIRKKNS